MAKLRHKYKDDPEAFAEEIVQTHLARPAGQSHLEYRGAPNEELDADFSVQEIRAVLQLLKTKSAPGPDNITNQILRNLNDDAIEKLCQYINAPRKRGPHPQAVVDARRWGIHVTTREGTRIPTVPKIRVLGLWLEENGANRELVARLLKKVAAATHLVRRVAKKRKGLKEHNVTKLIHAYALSRIAYVAAYADWNRSETDKLNVAIRKAFKTALGVPQYPQTCPTDQARGLKESLLPEVRDAILTENIPRNMHPVHDLQRRKCRAVAILKEHGSREGVLFVDAARPSFLRPVTSASMRGCMDA
ncbi:hypothetical protein MTO96_003624 [Rhipicephalus appendiculatus]